MNRIKIAWRFFLCLIVFCSLTFLAVLIWYGTTHDGNTNLPANILIASQLAGLYFAYRSARSYANELKARTLKPISASSIDQSDVSGVDIFTHEEITINNNQENSEIKERLRILEIDQAVMKGQFEERQRIDKSELNEEQDLDEDVISLRRQMRRLQDEIITLQKQLDTKNVLNNMPEEIELSSQLEKKSSVADTENDLPNSKTPLDS